ncbi:MAG: UDP-N-acetylmuramoyl-L-alanine--D-glutamate ligase [Desulfobulbaceae bacterium]
MADVAGKKCVVVGLGVSGLSAALFLHERGAQVGVSDARPALALDPAALAVLREVNIPVETGGHTHTFFHGAHLVVPSPGVPLELEVIVRAREQGAEVAGELALAAGLFDAPVIAVTGSNGKTTVTSLIAHLLREDQRTVFLGGNIGVPLLDYLRGEEKADVLVLELSSFQLEMSGSFRPDIGLLLNLSPDHIDRHGSMENYAAAKLRIFANQRETDIAIIGGDDPLLKPERLPGKGRVAQFGSSAAMDARVEEGRVLLSGAATGTGADEWYDVAGTPMDSRVNRLNAAAAVLGVRLFGCAPASVRSGLAAFKPPPHRMALVAEIEGVRYVNDSKGTNVGATAAALESCAGEVVLIAGGRDKASDFSLLADKVARRVREMVLIGEAADRIEKSLGSLVPVHRAFSMKEAVRIAAGVARPGDTVLLSPACASFDMFNGYAERGEAFEKAVRELLKVGHHC